MGRTLIGGHPCEGSDDSLSLGRRGRGATVRQVEEKKDRRTGVSEIMGGRKLRIERAQECKRHRAV